VEALVNDDPVRVKWAEAAAKLADATRKGAVTWTALDPTAHTFPGSKRVYPRFERRDVPGLAYFAQYKGKHIVVYESEFDTVDGDDNPMHISTPVVEFITADGILEMVWPFPYLHGSPRDLLQAVREQSSNAGDFLTAILGVGDGPP
jgi:hypothetical protein